MQLEYCTTEQMKIRQKKLEKHSTFVQHSTEHKNEIGCMEMKRENEKRERERERGRERERKRNSETVRENGCFRRNTFQ